MKKYIIIFVAIISIFSLTGCSKRALSKDKFEDITSHYKLKIIDVSNQFNEINDIKSATIAESMDLWKMEFYVLESVDAAKNMFNNNYNKYLDAKALSLYADKTRNKKYEEFTLINEENYMHVCRIKNTLLYVSAPASYKIDIEKVIRALKY